jgi:hypothetical protein
MPVSTDATTSGGAVVLVADGGVDVVECDVVDGGDAVARLAGRDEFCDRLGAGAAGECGFAEAVVGVEDDGDVASEGAANCSQELVITC